MARQAESYEVTAVVGVMVDAVDEKTAPEEAKTKLEKLNENLRVLEIGGISRTSSIVRAMVTLSLRATHEREARKTAKTDLEKLQLQNVAIRGLRKLT